MPENRLDPPLFIKLGHSKPVDLPETPYFHNDGGRPHYVASLPNGATLLEPARQDPSLERGHVVRVEGVAGVKQDAPYGVEKQLAFDDTQVRYEPMWATREAAAAFGITLVEPGEAVRLECPNPALTQNQYDYGVFAGHWSPYQGTGNALLSIVCTDLEHHDFPHVFASTDPNFPLVISVGRYWPKRGIMRLADLWVPQGSALYIPPMPDLPDSDCIDLHNNRNSAHACWGDIHQSSVETHTLLQTEGTFTHWYWNPAPTQHGHLNQGS